MSLILLALLLFSLSLNTLNLFMRYHECRETNSKIKMLRQVIEVLASASLSLFILFFVLAAIGVVTT